MIISLMVEVFIKAFLLLILLYIVARDEADFEFRKVLMVTAGIVLGAVILDAILTRLIGLFTLVPIAAFIVFMVMRFCWVRFGRSLLVAIPFLILNIMISTSVASFRQKADTAIARGLQGPVSDEDLKIALSFYQDGGRTNEMLVAMEQARSKQPQVEDTLEKIIFNTIWALFSSRQLPFKAVLAGKTPRLPPPRVDAPKPAEQEIETSRSEIHIGEQETTEPEWQEAEKKINLRGTLVGSDGVRVAVVNNQLVKEGEFIRVEHKKLIYRWKVRMIDERSVFRERMDFNPR